MVADHENEEDPTTPDSDSDERLRETLARERQSLLGLTRGMARLPLEQTAIALEASASIAGISLRASAEFLRAVPAAAQVLAPPELRSWGELGRRIAMSDVEAAIRFFGSGASELKGIPERSRAVVFQLCLRQLTLSASTATNTFKSLPALVETIDDAEMLLLVLEVAAEISRRSAKHSTDFLQAAPRVTNSLKQFSDESVSKGGLALASAFAARAGGIASDAWAALPDAVAGLNGQNALRLLTTTNDFLARGGGAALHVLQAGGEILRRFPQLFEDWVDLLWIVAEHGNASLVAFVRSTPRFIRGLSAEANRSQAGKVAPRVLALTKKIARLDGEAALSCFRSSGRVLRTVSIEQFEDWAERGLSDIRIEPRARRSYFALETRGSYEALHTGGQGLPLEAVQYLLKLYVEGLTGREVEVAPLTAVPAESRIGDGRTIHLPTFVNEFRDEDLDFRLYKVLAAHAAGQIEFGTYSQGTHELRAAFSAIAATYDPKTLDARDAFALDGYINVRDEGETVHSSPELAGHAAQLPTSGDYRNVLHLFPHSQLARRVFGTLENGRIDRRLRRQYRGLVRDLDLIREHLRNGRPRIIDLPANMAPFELLFQIALLGGALDDSREYYRQVVSELETIVAEYLLSPDATVADTLMATSRVYSLFQSITPANEALEQLETEEKQAETEDENMMASESLRSRREQTPERRDARELFNAWNAPNAEGEPDELAGAEAWSEGETPEQTLEAGEVAYNYDEWDRELTDHRLGWCRVIEKKVRRGERTFVEQTRERHKGVISSIRHQFQLMKPEDLTRVANELDGEDYDLNAVVDYVIDRRADGHQSERLYTKRLRRRRDVAVSFLLDQSSSTARTIGRHPLQPYTHPGRRIIEIEKEGLVLMSEALEAVGDVYSINGFTSEGRRNVKFYIVKDFDEKYTDEVRRRIGGITYQNNTRLGAAIRHATTRLTKQEARTRLLIVLSDGRPYDHDYGDARYAREDTREALRQAKALGITPFCITIDRESEAELRDLYGDIGYTIIDDVLSLPERLPGIYRRLTT